MAVRWSSPELAAQYSPHVEALREFFARQRLHYGILEDIATLAARLDASGSFRDDLSSMIRGILLREGISVSPADLLEFVIIAIAGGDTGKAPPEAQQNAIHPPIQQIFAFLNFVLQTPWDQPIGQERVQPEQILDDEAALKSSPVAPGICMPAESELPNEEDEQGNWIEEMPAPPVPAFAHPGTVTTSGTKSQVIASQTPALDTAPLASEISGAPGSNIAREPEAQEPFAVHANTSQISASRVRPWPKTVERPLANSNDATRRSGPTVQPAAANIFFPPPAANAAPAVAVSSHSYPESKLPPSTLDPEPPPPAAFRLPYFRLGPLHLSPAARIITPDQIRITLLSGIAASVFVTLMCTATRHSYSAIQAQKHSVGMPDGKEKVISAPYDRAVAAVPSTVGTSPEPPLIQRAATSPASRAVAVSKYASATRPHVAHQDDYLAPPFSTPIPTELAVHSPSPRALSRPASPNPITANASSRSNKADTAMEPSSAIQPRLLNVSSSEMAGNLVSAPAPRYPMLAKVAHLRGQVVVEAVVDRNGYVSWARALSGHRLLRSATVDEVLSRRYRPYLVHGHPVEVSTTITLDFPPRSTSSMSTQTATYVDLQSR